MLLGTKRRKLHQIGGVLRPRTARVRARLGAASEDMRAVPKFEAILRRRRSVLRRFRVRYGGAPVPCAYGLYLLPSGRLRR